MKKKGIYIKKLSGKVIIPLFFPDRKMKKKICPEFLGLT